MLIHKRIITDVYKLINNPTKIWHSCRGEILTVELQYNQPVVYYTNEPMADQEFFSYIMAVETGKEFPYVGAKEPKYLRTLMFDDGKYVLHFYTNT
jgi:hypothetical protein